MKKITLFSLALSFSALNTWAASSLQSLTVSDTDRGSFNPLITLQATMKIAPPIVLADDFDLGLKYPLTLDSSKGPDTITVNWSVTLPQSKSILGSVNFGISPDFVDQATLSIALASCPDVHTYNNTNPPVYYYHINYIYGTNISGFTVTLDPQTNNWVCTENKI